MRDALREAFNFITFTARLREVERHNNATPQRKESVAEHSWHLALVSWILHSEFEQELGHALDLEKMLKMCLMHDLVEIEAGDPSAWSTQHNTQRSDDKARIEEEVAQRRFSPLPGKLGAEFLDLWHEYEAGTTPEARIVRGVDRLNPALMRYLTGQGWQDVGADAEALDRLQLPRVQVSEALTALYQEIRDASVAQGLLPPAN
ncbi:HD domain-containing protein [Streptomyces sp. NBC_00654]|uniref:HD domain-containing protein n=1 Tax=Streptomyces sp. NBC_00654 TaxID=2975799 RepID=UPI00224DD5F0|nr:HD domain-containing protein [Streptomyces sp. NBC_00654]MCX4967156.1 HD domain-containing protein [Streptomyces sp. NBC_00654]